MSKKIEVKEIGSYSPILGVTELSNNDLQELLADDK